MFIIVELQFFLDTAQLARHKMRKMETSVLRLHTKTVAVVTHYICIQEIH